MPAGHFLLSRVWPHLILPLLSAPLLVLCWALGLNTCDSLTHLSACQFTAASVQKTMNFLFCRIKLYITTTEWKNRLVHTQPTEETVAVQLTPCFTWQQGSGCVTSHDKVTHTYITLHCCKADLSGIFLVVQLFSAALQPCIGFLVI